jgi:flagella basal body P-ring formation protein FlgA
MIHKMMALLAAGLMLVPGSALAGLSVEVADTARVAGAAVTIDDIAEVRGGKAGLRAKVRKLTVHRFQAGETEWRVSGRAIGRALWQAGVALDDVATDIPLGARVKREAREVDAGRVAAAVREHLRAAAGDGERVKVAFPEGTPAFEGLSGKARVRVARDGDDRVRVRVVTGGEVVASRTIPVSVKRQQRVVVARDHLAPGTRIKSGDVEVAFGAPGESRWAHFRSASEVVGTWVLKPVGEGQPVPRANLRMAPDVRPGDPVTLVYESDKLRLSVAGVVRQQGAVGEVLAMENRDSGKRVYARLTGPSTAKVAKRRMSRREDNQ